MMDELYSKRIAQLEEARAKVRLGGGEDRIEKHHSEGKMTARERLDFLLDPDSFLELNMLAGHKLDAPADGLVCGSGTINCRQVFVYSQDRTVRGGSVGIEHGYKMYRTIERALEMRAPLIGLHDSPGARLPNQDELEFLSAGKRSIFGSISQKHGGSVFYPNTLASGIIPQISAIMGACGGISVYSPALNDFVFMVDKTSHMFITGPMVVQMVTGEEISMEDLGGARVHAQVSGNCDFRSPDEKTLLTDIRTLLSYLPLNCDEQPPIVETGDDPDRMCHELADIVPTAPNKPYDVREAVKVIVDNGDFFEVKKEFAKEVVVGFARLDGRSVGIIANQPKVMAGSMTVNSSDKQARFIRFCDSFNIPLVLLVDTPAYLPGSAQEHAGIIRHGAKVLYALCEAAVPRISVVTRKAYGGGNLGMGVLPGLGTDLVVYWPIMETGILGADQSVMLLYGRHPDAMTDPDFLQNKLKEYRETYANPIYDVSSNTNVEEVVAPAETRRFLIKALKMLRTKTVNHPVKRHGNIPL
ncbi:acyl-CoA carboxylase subunit beta [Desulfatibacillum aliphaticivorans]|nr:acyl-CoA carboxylase subunit beta [Desulfatibacillum aliphaticivorans]